MTEKKKVLDWSEVEKLVRDNWDLCLVNPVVIIELLKNNGFQPPEKK